jgi:PAS domain S-box-containing protein
MGNACTSQLQIWLSALLESSMDALVVLDRSECIRLLNQHAEAMFARRADELLGKPVDVLLWPGSRQRQQLAGATTGEKLQLDGSRAGNIRFHLDVKLSSVADGSEEFLLLVMREVAPSAPRLRRRADSTQQAHELEKRRVSRELYDELGQRLSVLKLDMDWLERAISPSGQLSPARIAQMQALLDSVIIRIKTIASGLRPPLLDDIGLLAAIRWLAQSFERETGIYTEVISSGRTASADEAIDTAVYRVAQEALLNVQRHARASHVRIEIREEQDRIHALIEDDGDGMPRGAEHKPGCFGLAAMQERIYTLGGTFDIHSREGQGSVIQVSIPIEPGAAKLRTS